MPAKKPIKATLASLYVLSRKSLPKLLYHRIILYAVF